jgi:hypothetical protein
MNAVSRRTNFFADERAKVSKVTIAKVAENIDKPCAWIKSLTPSVATLDETPHWGFIGFRDATTECSNEVWETFMKQFDEYVTRNCLNFLTGGAALIQQGSWFFEMYLLRETIMNGYASMCTVYHSL